MDNWLMILVSVGMIMLFIGPFVIVSAIKKREEKQRKQKAIKNK
jgi:hypothetical protein